MADPKLQIILAAKDVTGKALTKFQGRITAITKSVFSFRGALGSLAGAGGFGILITKSVETADAIAKTADKLGITTTALQEYRYAAERSGVETKTLDMALQRFTRRTAEAAQGKGELKDVLEQYNIAVRDAAGNTRTTEDVFRDLAEVIRTTTDPAERLRIAFKAFDSEGAALVNMLRDGAGGLDKFAKKARELGIILNGDLLEGSTKAKDAMDDLGKVIEVNFSRVVLENVESMTTAVESLANAMSKVAKYAGLRSISATFSEGSRLAREGKIDWQQFWKAGFVDRQRMVDEALGAGGPQIFRAKMPPRPGAAPQIPAASMPTAKMDAHVYARERHLSGLPGATAEYDQTWGAGELSRFAQYDVLVRDSEKAYEDMTGHVSDYMDYAETAYETLDSRISLSFNSAADAVAEFAVSGKLNFKEFANSLIADLVRMQTKMSMMKLFEALPGLFSGAGGASGHIAPNGAWVGAGGTTAVGFHEGGHIGEPIRGIGLRSGQSYEFHANETVIPDSKLGGGGSKVIINHNNYTGQPANTTQSMGPGGEKIINISVGNSILQGGPEADAIAMRFGLQPVGKRI